MKGFKEYIAESSLSRIWAKTQKHTCGAITAWRGENTRAENKARNKELVDYLRGKGYSITNVKGTYIENKGKKNEKEVGESSYIVCNHKVEGDDGGELERDLIKLGKRYNQDSILIIPVGGKGAYLYGTSKTNDYPPMDKTMKVGDRKMGKTAGEFISRIRGREFAFEEVEMPGTINGIRGLRMFAEKLDREMDEE